MTRQSPRVASLLPAATEIVAGLGAESALVGVSHECDYPPSVQSRPRLTWSPIDLREAGDVIHARVRSLHAAGQPVITIHAATLEAVAPDLVLTQDLCEVCAVVDGDIRSLADLLCPPPRIVSLSARTLPGIWEDIETVGRALGREDRAAELVDSLRTRLRRLSIPPSDSPKRVVVIEWLEPLFLAGHWVPDLVRAAGGVDVGAEPGAHSRASTWAAVAALRPDVIVIALCGFGLERAVAEWRRFVESRSDAARQALALETTVFAIDGNAYTSRPGPRTVEAAALIQRALIDQPGSRLLRLR